MALRSGLFVLPLLLATAAPAAEPAPVAALVAKVDIPYDSFALPNGLRVVVHTDRKTPVVAVSVWYHVGSKDEPAGKTGFAHLFEHLMFNGSENSPGDFFEPLKQIGATDYNGTTSFDRTNYFETVPTAALETALFLESDRMGHLLGGIDQAKLDNQRAVVQNEKRQGDNQPFGQLRYVVDSTLFPPGHPYHHQTIGSMADLNVASLATVKDWFRSNYGAANAVLVLAGDIDVADAKPLAAKWFGAVPAGRAIAVPAVPIPTLPAPVARTLTDRVPYSYVARYWAVEGVNGQDTTAVQVAAAVLGGLSSSRLDNALVRGEATAVQASASVDAREQAGVLSVSVVVKPGQDANAVGRRLDAIVADFLASGPTEDEVRRVATRSISGTLGGLESVGGFGGKAVALAEGLVYSNDPAKYKQELAELAAVTPAQVLAAARKWMARPVFALKVVPGERDTSPAMLALTGDAPSVARPAVVAAAPPPTPTRAAPAPGPFAALRFPTIERATLANGIRVYFARRAELPVVRFAVSFDAGSAADPAAKAGLQALTMALLDEGTVTRSSRELAEIEERLGASLNSGGGTDRSQVSLYALTANLAPSLDLLADVVRNPAFQPGEVERLRGQQLAGIAGRLSDPAGIATYLLPNRIYGEAHPYGQPGGGQGSFASVRTITRDDVVRFQRDWLVPDKASIFVVGDTTLADLKPLLEARFGNWPSNRMARPVKNYGAAIPPATATRLTLVDRPGSPQSVIVAGQALSLLGSDDALVPLQQANDVLGGSFLSRLNMDLRETKGWSYGVSSGISAFENRVPFILEAPVQTDRTGDSVAAMLADIRDFVTTKGTTSDELRRTTNGSIRELPGGFETSEAVLGAMQRIVFLGRPDNFYQTLGDRYRAMTAADLDRVARHAIDPSKLAIIIVGDAKTVRPQLAKLGLPVETMQLPTAQ